MPLQKGSRMDDLATAYRQDHLVNYVAPIGPPLMIVVATFFIFVQSIDILSMPDHLNASRILLLTGSLALYAFAPLVTRYARSGRANAAALSAVGFLTLLSAGVTYARYEHNMNWMLMLPFAGIYTMVSTLFWSRKTHLGLGLMGSMGIPTTATLITATTREEFIIRAEFAVAIMAFSIALYFLMFQAQTRSHRTILDAEYRAQHDWLTGLMNRQHWMLLARKHFEMTTAAAPLPMSLLYIDIDHFKQTNDNHGHEAGDCQLRMVAETLRSTMPTDALIGRFGGEEFIVLLPDTILPGAVALSERINKGLADNPDSIAPLTASIGIAEWVADESIEQLIARADRAMLQAKGLGRSQTVVAGPIIMRPQPTRPASSPSPLWMPVGEIADQRVSSSI
jgi:diguanylate cyclase (GGDEF)-like protein